MLEVGNVAAGGRPGLCLEGDELRIEPAAPVRLADVGRKARTQAGGVVRQAGRRHGLLRGDPRPQVGRAEVAVDEPRDQPVESQGEEQVVAGDRIRHRDVARSPDGEGAIVRAGHRCIFSGRGARRRCASSS